MTIYLTCSLNRGHQRKHIDVCHRCIEKTGCKAYQEHARQQPESQKRAQDITGNDRSMKNDLVHQVVAELKTIQALLHKNSAEQRFGGIEPGIDTLPDLSLDSLRGILKEIQADCRST